MLYGREVRFRVHVALNGSGGARRPVALLLDVARYAGAANAAVLRPRSARTASRSASPRSASLPRTTPCGCARTAARFSPRRKPNGRLRGHWE